MGDEGQLTDRAAAGIEPPEAPHDRPAAGPAPATRGVVIGPERTRGAESDDDAENPVEMVERSARECEDRLSPELHHITLPLKVDEVPSDAELRIAHAPLVGWLEGLFHGIQTALVAQQMAVQTQLAQMRRTLPEALKLPPARQRPSETPRANTSNATNARRTRRFPLISDTAVS